ncbi:MAG: FAD-dependent oxidoreductase [Chloroflexi bacterium]|nr:FAD-dependent oxidoreductase [Chloroflexota bacterium]
MEQRTIYDVVILGQGVAGFSAGLYAARYQIKAVIIGETFGGETATGGLIENYPGIVSIEGYDLMLQMKEQVEKYDVPVIDEKADAITKEGDCFLVHAGGEIYQGNTVILAVGRERRKLGLPREEELTGRGVSYCSTCDAPLYRGKTVGVVGGGDAAVKGATLISKYADKVYVIYRGEKFSRPEPVNVKKLEESSNAQPVFQANVVELKGGETLSGLVLDRRSDGSNELVVDGVFVEIGADPNADLAVQLGVSLTEENEIDVDKLMQTNVEGVFAAGDVTNASGHLKQAITAAAQGALAATSAYGYVSEHANACETHAVGFSLD